MASVYIFLRHKPADVKKYLCFGIAARLNSDSRRHMTACVQDVDSLFLDQGTNKLGAATNVVKLRKQRRVIRERMPFERLLSKFRLDAGSLFSGQRLRLERQQAHLAAGLREFTQVRQYLCLH